MKASVGLLRERLAHAEVARVTRVAEGGGAPALFAHAAELLKRAAEEEARLRALAARVEREPAGARENIDAYLVETAESPAQLRADRRGLRRSGGTRVNVPALTERVARRVFRAELECEVALAISRAYLTPEIVRHLPAHAQLLLDLAYAPGRWSRRVEALVVLRALCRYPLTPSLRAHVADACEALAHPSQQRWVQPAAAEVLARVDAERALRLVVARFERPADATCTGDNELGGEECTRATCTEADFLVRERFVELAARIRRAEWHVVLELGASDPSEHVRLTAARVDRDAFRLEHAATSDASEKVRAAALISLTKRAGAAAEPTLARAAKHDPSAFVARTAAESLTVLAQRKVLRNKKDASSALAAAGARTDLPPAARAGIVEELAALEVLADPLLRIFTDLVGKIAEHAPVGGGVKIRGPAFDALGDEQIGRVLSVLSRADFALSADRRRGGLVVYRGESRRLALWRVLTELVHPLPSKRQGYTHSWGRELRGHLRAPPRGLAELTATSVPGERVLSGKTGDWARHLPLVDDLLHAGVFRGAPTFIVGPAGTTVMTPPASFARRVAAWFAVSRGYRALAELRRRSVDSDEPAVQRGFADAVVARTGIRLDFIPHAFASGLPCPAELDVRPLAPPRAGSSPGASTAAVAALPLAPFLDGVTRDFLHYAVSPEGNRLPHVGAYAAIVLIGMISRGVLLRRLIDADRKAIPMVIGGWGTRGKSGTERIKAGLLQGLGYEVLVKTTGCEAMFIHAMPGLRAQEVFIYRPYDKATVWEQRTLLQLGRRFGVRAFLWECMALQPDLVNLLQSQWMRDDYSTITNAYPDHEDVQGPAGFDVAQVISEFVPTRGRLFTAEDQMLPVLRERAKARGTSLRVVGDREATLIADDVLARFPYHEHPKNIALVCAMAQALGVPTSIALAEMADHVVPDLGVLKTYPRVVYERRTLAFTNGMSANERTGALSNWVRMGFDKHDPDADPARRIVTVVNNRADRVARSEVFARFLVQDIGAHVHVLIGTNVSGLLVFLREAMAKHVVDIAPSRDLGSDPAERRKVALTRLDRAFRRLKIGRTSSESVLAEVRALGLPPLDAALVEAALAPASMDERFASARAAVEGRVPPEYPAESRPFVVAMIARRRVVRAVYAALDALLEREPARLDRVFGDAYRALLEDQLVPLADPTLTGDQIIDTIARRCPPGATVDIMGVQNIKGTGLDFVYRWVSLDVVERALAKVRSSGADEHAEGLRELQAHDDFGLVDATHALAALEAVRAESAPERHEGIGAASARIAPIAERRRAALGAKSVKSASHLVRAFVGKTFDYLDSIRRQRMARAVLADLVAGRVSHAAAAVEMRAIVARAKGAWATRGKG